MTRDACIRHCTKLLFPIRVMRIRVGIFAWADNLMNIINFIKETVPWGKDLNFLSSDEIW
jgi:hypothetical protein